MIRQASKIFRSIHVYEQFHVLGRGIIALVEAKRIMKQALQNALRS